MRQVPQYLLIGGGRLAQHFRYYFSELKLPFTTWQRQEPLAQLQQKLAVATHVLLLISDSAIEDFILQHLKKSSAILLHCSGSLVTEHAYGAHPLMCFSHHLYDLTKYQTIHFVIDADAPEFRTLLPGVPNPHVRLDKALKAKYHALCVLSGNFTCLLWKKFFDSLQQELNLPPQIAHAYLLQNTQNILQDANTALTGPLVRNDSKTIEDNLAALSGDPFQDVYKSFVACYQKSQE